MLLPSRFKILMNRTPIDMRRAIDGLSILIADAFHQNPVSEYLFVFRNKRGDKIKILYWDRNGFCLWYKRLEKGRFYFPPIQTDCLVMTSSQLNWLLDGLDFLKLSGHQTLYYDQHF